jgi:hypothetical protein
MNTLIIKPPFLVGEERRGSSKRAQRLEHLSMTNGTFQNWCFLPVLMVPYPIGYLCTPAENTDIISPQELKAFSFVDFE